MANISVEDRAKQFAGHIVWLLEIDDSHGITIERHIEEILRVQDKDTRHACAEQVASISPEAHSRVMNCCAGLKKL